MIIGFEKTYKIFLLWIFFSLLSFAFSEEWKSELYPEDWKPGYIKDKLFFLQDYSYAGYKNAIYKSKKYPAKKVIVTDYGADSTGEKDSSEAFSKAVNAATHYKGAEIFIPPGKYLLTKPIKIFHNNIVLRGAGKSKTKLRFSGSFPANIFFSGKGQHRTEIKLLKDTEIFSKQIFPEHTDGLEKGMDIDIGIVITESFIHDHQMGKYWKFAKNKWRTFFRREIKTVDHKNNSVTFEVPIRYSLKCRDNLSLKIVDGYLSECGIENLSVCNATDKKNAWKYDRRHVIEFRSVKDCWVSGVDSFPSAVIEQKGMHLQSGGIIIRRSKKMTVSDCDFNNPQNRGGGGNGYLFEISQSCEILTKDCRAENGRHNFIQNWDFNTNGCVWLRVNSSGSRAFKGSWDPIGFPAASEFHHA
ncbi:MAG: glycosyl hydrolase family 28-related protein, partial [Verrucomicrobiota bacterium]|nr:glycosyl hydrolase family 28-related protein [Verrucomicrobiota bacterium]